MFKIHTHLEQFNDNPKNLIALLQSIKLIRENIKPHMANINPQLLNAIKQQEDKNILNLMKPLLDDKIAYDELSESIADIENLLSLTTPHSEELNNGWNRLHNHFQQRTLRREQNEKAAALTIEAEHCMDDINKNPWQPLEEKTQKHFELLKCLQTLFPLLRHNPPVSIDHKEQYIDMLRAGFELTHDPKFIDTLSSSLDLFYSKNNEPPQALMDYIKNSQNRFNQQPILNTNNSGQNPKKRSHFTDKNNIEGQPTQKKIKPILKKVHFDNNLNYVQNEYSTSTYSETEHAFIHLLNPLLTHSIDLNPMFAAQILTSLAAVSSKIEKYGVPGGPLLTIKHDLLHHAKDFCQQAKNPDKALLNHIKNRIEPLITANQRLFNDYDKFKSSEKTLEEYKLKTQAKPFKEQFQHILTDLIDELGGHIANATQKDRVIWDLRMDLFNHLAKSNMKDHVIQQFRTALQSDLANNKTQDHFIQSMQQNLNDMENQNKIASASHDETPPYPSVNSISHTIHFKNLNDAIQNGSPEAFQAYINQKKNEFADKNKFCNFLTEDKKGFTALHNAYDGQFETFSLYIKAIKATMEETKQQEKFIPFLIQKTPLGSSFFHQLFYRSENFDYIKKTTALMRKELGNDLYRSELSEKDNAGYYPSKPRKSPIHDQVKEYIKSECKTYGKPQGHLNSYNHSFFNHHVDNNAPRHYQYSYSSTDGAPHDQNYDYSGW